MLFKKQITLTKKITLTSDNLISDESLTNIENSLQIHIISKNIAKEYYNKLSTYDKQYKNEITNILDSNFISFVDNSGNLCIIDYENYTENEDNSYTYDECYVYTGIDYTSKNDNVDGNEYVSPEYSGLSEKEFISSPLTHSVYLTKHKDAHVGAYYSFSPSLVGKSSTNAFYSLDVPKLEANGNVQTCENGFFSFPLSSAEYFENSENCKKMITENDVYRMIIKTGSERNNTFTINCASDDILFSDDNYTDFVCKSEVENEFYKTYEIFCGDTSAPENIIVYYQ